jgi:hypothetical protein
MPTPTEHKTFPVRILARAQEVGWTVVSRKRSGGQDLMPMEPRLRNGHGGSVFPLVIRHFPKPAYMLVFGP